jgi:3-deoxy-manno-octulosonate cytidylyltransferase (CMP-KDO synthetase)
LFHHVGIYAYTRHALAHFVKLSPSTLEKREKLEQLRALEAGMTIAVARIAEVPLSIDTPTDLEKARRLIAR